MGEANIVPSAAPVITLRVTVRAPDLESFIDRYAKHINGDRIFIFTKNPQAIGTRVRFTLQLESGEPLIQGKGTVTRVQNEGNPRRPPGMELVFVALDDRSQTLVDFMLASRVAEAPPIVRAVAAAPTPPPLRSESAPAPPAATAPIAPATARADVTPGPAPAFAEKWREPLPPGVPAAGAEHNLPANPFSEVSDGAIEYFVEWSIEQSIGAPVKQTASFSDVPMALPQEDSAPVVAPSRAKRVWAIGAGCFAAGTMLGLVPMLLVRSPRATAAVAAAPAAAPAPPAVAPAPTPAAPPPVAAPPPTLDPPVELAVLTRPPGASVRVDGAAVGVTPVVTKISPGRHAITVSKERYEQQTTEAEAPTRVQLTLKRPMATLHIVSTPPEALVTIDGVKRGLTPANVRLPAFESYAIEVQRAGARTWRRAIYVRGIASTIVATLAATPPKKPPAKLGQR
jgi:uncharacterized protein (TIGR02266 family)